MPDPELQDHFRDVLDHVLRLSERIAAFRALLQNALAVNAALVAQRQNDEMRLLTESSIAQNEQIKRISSWAAILFAPTLIASIYGMNFRLMPELDWIFGYPMALGLMLVHGRGPLPDVQAQQVDLSGPRVSEAAEMRPWPADDPQARAAPCAPGGNRTPDRRIRRPLLYPLSYWGTFGVLPGCCRGRLKKFTVPGAPCQLRHARQMRLLGPPGWLHAGFST